MSLRLEICGKLLRCAHQCLEKAGMDHICACKRKWTFDPGCKHLVSGTCSDFTNLSLVCTKTCGKPLICGHPCSAPCSSHGCFCNVCFDKHSTASPMTVIKKKLVDSEKTSPAITLNLNTGSSKTASTDGPFLASSKVAAPVGTSAGPFPGLSNMAFVDGSSAGSRPGPSKTASASGPFPGSSKMTFAPGSSAGPFPNSSKMTFARGKTAGAFPGSSKMGSTAGPSAAQFPGSSQMGSAGIFGNRSQFLQDPLSAGMEKSEFAELVNSALLEAFAMENLPVPQPATDLPQHELEMVKKLMFDSAVNKDDPSTWDHIRRFKRCINGHVFFAERDFCHICRGSAHGPTFSTINVTPRLPEMQEFAPFVPDPGLNDDNAWKFGMTKCLDGHYFRAELRCCDSCGKPSAFGIPGAYLDSDSD